jgi:hypothetical protein
MDWVLFITHLPHTDQSGEVRGGARVIPIMELW